MSLLKCKKLDYSPSEPQKKIHPEREEKPVVESVTKSSEETHGGTESTVSIPFSPSPNALQTGERREGAGLSQTQAQKGSAKEADDRSGREHEEEVSGVSENGEDGEASASRSGEGSEDEEDASDGFEGDEGAEVSENDEDEGDIDEGDIYVRNTMQVVDLNCRRTFLSLATEFYRLLEILMEEKTKVFDNRGREEYNIRKLILRPYAKKPLGNYMQTRVKESMVVLLDNSGSMDWWAENLQLLASIALSRNDIEIYAAPNGNVQTRLTNRGYVPVDHEEVIKKLQGRRVIYVGDYDGANTPVELSWRNEVIWICPESRFRRFKSHDWVSYTEEDFRGVFIRSWTLEEAFSALKKVDRFYNVWIDFHEDHSFSDDAFSDD